MVKNLYGYPEDFTRAFVSGLTSSKCIYECLLEDIISRNGSLIPSRNEKRSINVKWSLAWFNLNIAKGLTALEKEFAWKVQQDMLPVGNRIHRRNAERRCLAILDNNQVCLEVETLEHRLVKCNNISPVYNILERILETYLDRVVSSKEIINLAFNHRNKKRLVCALWLSVKILYILFLDKSNNKAQIFTELIKEIDWNLSLNRKIGSQFEMRSLKNIIKACCSGV